MSRNMYYSPPVTVNVDYLSVLTGTKSLANPDLTSSGPGHGMAGSVRVESLQERTAAKQGVRPSRRVEAAS